MVRHNRGNEAVHGRRRRLPQQNVRDGLSWSRLHHSRDHPYHRQQVIGDNAEHEHDGGNLEKALHRIGIAARQPGENGRSPQGWYGGENGRACQAVQWFEEGNLRPDSDGYNLRE